MVNLLAISTLFFVSTVCQRNAMKAKSETTHGFGRYRVNSLVRIRARDVRGPPMNTTEEIPVWSSVKGKYTPWIAYRGCYQISTLSTNQSTRSLMVNNNSVGACYWQCKMKALKKSLCENTTGIQFGLQKSHCFCYYKGPARGNLDQSDKCNISCSPSSFEEGECGGQGHFSAYEEYLPTETVVEGDCLICSKNISQITVRGVECNGNALGLCVSGDSVNSSSLFNGTFNACWNTCKQNNKFITGNTHIVCQSESTWTGIRKYNIDTDNYRNSTTAVKAESPSLTLTKDTLVIILGVSGTTVAVCVFLLLYHRVLRERCRKPETSHVHLNNIGHITHLNTTGQFRSKADSKAQNRYQSIVPNCGNNHFYGHIHKSEQESGPKFVIVQ